jgi:hypothetical protein
MNRFAVVVAGLLLASCSPVSVEKPREICGNGLDDDMNGFTDCQDPDCAGQSGCPMASADGGGNFGTCSKCGNSCVKQSECLAVDFGTDTPLPECVGGRCQQFNKPVQVAFEVDTQGTWNGFMYPIRSMNTRMLSKLAKDGTAVTCATVIAAAAGKTEADADQIEKSGLFNLRGYDVAPVQAMGGIVIRQPFLNVGTGSNFIIWTELWAGPRGTLTKLPTGNRYGWGCFEMGPEVAEVIAADHCGTGSPTCRTIRVKMPGPQM